MAQTSQFTSPSEDMYLSDIVSGAHGDKFQKDLAKVIFERATRKKYDFRLGYEMAIADKFDDVAFFNKKKNEWSLIQTKHALKGKSQPLRFDMLFPTDEGTRNKGDFSLFKYLKSYVTVQANIKERKNVIIFTNRDLLMESLEPAVTTEPREVDEILCFENARHVGLKVNHQLIQEMLDFVNREFNTLRNSIIKLFKEGIVDQTLQNFKTPVSHLLTIINTNVKFSEAHSSETCQILASLSEVIDIQIAHLPLDKCKDLFTGKPRKKMLPILVEEDTVHKFFQDLILSVRQPDELHDIIDQDLRAWMRTWMQPGYLQRLEEPQLAMNVVSLGKTFNENISRVEIFMHGRSYKKFLDFTDGEKLFWNIKKDLEQQFRHQSIYSLGYASEFYVSRQIEYEEVNELLIRDFCDIADTDEGIQSENRLTDKFSTPSLTKPFCRIILQTGSTVKKIIRDDKFVDELSSFFEKQRILLITAEPGMGKSTILEFIALTAQQKNTDCVYLFNLNTFNKDLSKLQETDSIDKLLSVLGTALSVKNFNDLRDTINRKYIKRKHLMIFDAFDEVFPVNRNKVFKIFKLLLDVPNVVLLISARRTVKTLFETEFEVKALSLKPFSELDQTQFLRRFLKVSNANEDSFQKFASQLFKSYHSDINRALLEFTGIPLMLKMLAEVYTEHIEVFFNTRQNNLCELMSQEKLSIVNLYEQFVRKCFANKMKKRFTSFDSFIDEEFAPMFKTFTLEHELLAIKHLQIKPLQIVFENEKYVEMLNEFEKRILKGAEASPLFEAIDHNICFMHLSYAEFLVAKFMLCNIENYAAQMFDANAELTIFGHFPLIKIFFFTMIEMQYNEQTLQTIAKYYNKNSSIVLWACEANGIKTIKYLLQIKTNSTIIKQLMGVTAQNNCYKICEYLLENHRNVEAKACTLKGSSLAGMVQIMCRLENCLVNASGTTPLHLASEKGHSEVVKVLIDHSADINAKTINGSTPLSFATKNGHLAVVKALIDNAVEVNAKIINGWTPLHYAAMKGYLEIVKVLIDHSGNINAKTNKGSTPLSIAAAYGHSEVVKVLIDHAAKVGANMIDDLDLHFAARYGHLEDIKVLMDHSNDVNAKANNFSVTVEYSRLESAKCNFLCFTKVNAKIIDDWTPLHFAARNGQSEYIKDLIEHSMDVNAKTNEGFTPLSIASEHGHLEIVKTLLDHSADVNEKINNDLTPLHYAALKGHLEVVKVLIDHSIDVNTTSKNGYTPLSIAAGNGFLDVVKILLKHSGNVNIKSYSGSTPLSIAAARGHLEVVKTLINHSADVNAKSYDDLTPLHYAAMKGHLEVVKVLINHSKDVNATSKNGLTPLYIAAGNGHSEVVQTLIKHSGDVNTKIKNGSTPISIAVERGQFEVVKILIRHSADVSAKINNDLTPLHYAVLNGHLEVVKVLIDHSIDVNATSKNGYTPLSIAAGNGHLDAVKILIKHSGNVNIKTYSGSTPLSIAAARGHLEVVKTLINHSADVNAKTYNDLTPLLIAAGNGHLKIVKTLINHSADVNAKINDDSTPLHYAALNGHFEVVQTLIKHASNVNAVSKNGFTPLCFAAQNGHMEIVKFLVDHSGDVNAKTNNGFTPLSIAAECGHLEVVKALIDCSADVNSKTNHGSTPLSFAAEQGHLEIVKTLISHSADVNAKINDDSTALHFGAMKGHLEIVKVLMNHSKDYNLTSKNGLTPLYCAAQNGHLEVVKVLIDHSGDVNAKTFNGFTPLSTAAENGHLKVVNVLINHNADVNAKTIDDWTPLHYAAMKGHSEVVKALIKHSRDVDVKTKKGWTPLHLSVENGHLEVVKILVDCSGDVNAKTFKSSTPISLAIKNGHLEVLKILSDHTENLMQ